MASMELPLRRLSAVLAIMNPDLSTAYKRVREVLRTDPAVAAATTNFHCDIPGISWIFNRATPSHYDVSDPVDGMSLLLALAREMEGGDLVIPVLGVRMAYNSGTVVAFRGKLFRHEVEEFEGERICVASFVHQRILDHCNVSLPPLATQTLPLGLPRLIVRRVLRVRA